MFDFVRFITMACDAEVRRQVEPLAVDKFFDLLTEEYAKLGQSDFKPSYTREQVKKPQNYRIFSYLVQRTFRSCLYCPVDVVSSCSTLH